MCCICMLWFMNTECFGFLGIPRRGKTVSFPLYICVLLATPIVIIVIIDRSSKNFLLHFLRINILQLPSSSAFLLTSFFASLINIPALPLLLPFLFDKYFSPRSLFSAISFFSLFLKEDVPEIKLPAMAFGRFPNLRVLRRVLARLAFGGDLDHIVK